MENMWKMVIEMWLGSRLGALWDSMKCDKMLRQLGNALCALPESALGRFAVLCCVGLSWQCSTVVLHGAVNSARTVGLNFDNGPVKSRFFPRNFQAPGTPTGTTVVLQPEFVDGMENMGLRSREDMDGMILDLGTAGGSTFSPKHSSVRFWFRPDWSSGEGPGGYGSFFSLGKWMSPSGEMKGYWGLSMDPKGERIQLGAQSTEEGDTFISAPLQFTKNQWYDITISYSEKESWIYMGSKTFGPGKGISIVPPSEALTETGLAVGNTPWGYQPVKGVIDEFEIFNYPLRDPEADFKYFALSGRVEKDPVSVRLQWAPRGGVQYMVKRRKSDREEWGIIAEEVDGFQYLDTSDAIMPGQVYQYQVHPYRYPGTTNQVNVAVFMPPVHHRGKMLLLVDETQHRALRDDLKDFKRNLELDGWSVVVDKAPRHSDRRWKTNIKRIAEVKEIIHTHLAPPVEGMKALLILGHVAVPYSGYAALDGHVRPGDDHRGAWSCDAYYGDLDGVWRDQSVNHTGGAHFSNHNVPGDGKFDEDRMPTRLEVAVGRVDFANLPNISGAILKDKPRRKSQVETELLRQYLHKNLAYRKGDISFDAEAVIRSFLPRNQGMSVYKPAIMNAANWYGHVPGPIRMGDGFIEDSAPLWSFMGGQSGSASFANGVRRTRDFNRPEKAPHAAFMMFYSSWHGDWNLPDSFLRACLTTPESGLASFSMLVGPWRLGDLGRGESLGYSYLQSANQRPVPATRALAIMGDPTLRMFVTSPVAELDLLQTGQTRQLTWKNPRIRDFEGIYVYHFDNELQRFETLTRLDPSLEHWNLPDQIPSQTRLMIRVGQWIHSGSGSFVSLSHGVESLVP